MAILQEEQGSIMYSSGSKRICPYVKETYDECLPTGTRSNNAEAAIRLCAGNFEACEIYRRRIREQTINQ